MDIDFICVLNYVGACFTVSGAVLGFLLGWESYVSGLFVGVGAAYVCLSFALMASGAEVSIA